MRGAGSFGVRDCGIDRLPSVLLLGLTGSIASGKSTVSARLRTLGATLIDADVLAREAVAPGSPVLAAIRERWGPSVMREDGALDRAALRQVVFGDPAERAALEALVHPDVERRRTALLAAARARGDAIVICDIPLLFEKGMEGRFDAVIVVDADPARRRERLMATRGLSADVAQAMIDAQWPDDAKRARADYVIANNGSLAELEAQVDRLWTTLVARAGTPPLPPADRNR